jgi:hypothetical protein
MKETVQAELQLLGRQQSEDERILTGPATELEFLEAVYLNENLPLGYRLKAAAERAKYTHAQLRAVFSTTDQDSFAAALERAIERSQAPYVPRPALAAPVEEHPASEVSKPFVMRRRNLR